MGDSGLREELRKLAGNGGNRTLEGKVFDTDIPMRWPKIATATIAGLSILWGSCFYVPVGHKGIVTRFGQYHAVAENGLHGKFPLIDSVQKKNVEEVRRMEFGYRTVSEGKYEDVPEESLMITGDENLVDVSWVVQSKIRDPVAYTYSMADPETTLYDISESVMRLVVGDSTVDSVMTDGKTRIQERAKVMMQEIVNAYNMGLDIQSVQLQDVDPPTAAVQQAFAAVNSAKEKKAQMLNQADTYEKEQLPAARASAKKTIEDATGYAAQVVNDAEGQRDAFLDVFKEYHKAPELTRRRIYIETMEDAGPKLKLYVMNGKQGVIPLLDLKKE